jgi:hypothetical protein
MSKKLIIHTITNILVVVVVLGNADADDVVVVGVTKKEPKYANLSPVSKKLWLQQDSVIVDSR